jgi:dihydrofolate reductase
MVKAIWAQSTNDVIGQNGKLPWHIPSELKHFKNETLGKTVVVGRKTYESIPNNLPGRQVIVLTKNKAFVPDADNVHVAHNKFDVYIINRELKDAGKTDGEVIIAGGASIYELFTDEIYEYVVTVVNKQIEGEGLEYLPSGLLDKYQSLISKYSYDIDDHSEYFIVRA